MGLERMHAPKYWRMRAEEFRTRADNYGHGETREALRKAAKTYEDLAAERSRSRRSVTPQSDAAGRPVAAPVFGGEPEVRRRFDHHWPDLNSGTLFELLRFRNKETRQCLQPRPHGRP